MKREFKRVVEYYYPNGDIFEDGRISFYFIGFIAFLVVWVGYLFKGIFYPLFFIFNKKEDYRGYKKIYWTEIRKPKLRSKKNGR